MNELLALVIAAQTQTCDPAYPFDDKGNRICVPPPVRYFQIE